MLKIFAIILILIYITTTNVKAKSITSRIVNGNNATITPFHAHILIRTLITDPPSQTFVGSGAIITESHVLTVAQNVHGFSHWEIQVGSTFRFDLQSHSSIVSYVHPFYNPANLDNNLAILQLQIPIVPSFNTHPIELPFAAEGQHPLVNELGTVTGFGFTEDTGTFAVYLKQTFLRVQPQEVCLNEYPHLLPLITGHFCTLYDDQILPANICAGDQGAPFFLILRGINVLLGIASFTNPICSGINNSAVFVRVSQYVDWINGII